MARRVKVAAVQMRCDSGAAERNLERARALVEQAVADGAELVLLPELTPGGYLLTEAIWETAETVDGPSLAWLRATAARLGIHLGMTFLEVEGEHFYNTFVLATPEGRIAGRVRKSPPASVEAYFFRAGADSRIIDTSLGRIGVGICYENLLYDTMARLCEARVDLVLQPTSAATPTPNFPFRRKDAEAFDRMLAESPVAYARALGVPVVMANKCGPLVTDLPGGFPSQNTVFPGLSCVVDGDGTPKVRLQDQEGVAVAEVVVDPARKVTLPPKPKGRWAVPVPWYGFLWPLSEGMGRRAYDRNPRRRARALAMTAPA